MTTPTGTPDWAKPLPGGARTLVNQIFNLQAAGGNFVTPWFDVTAFNGLHIQTNGFADPAHFGTMQVQFQDASNTQLIFPAHTSTWRGDLALDINVPVMGAQARIVITGPADNVNATLLVVGHGGGAGSSVGRQGEVLLGGGTVNVPANTVQAFVAPVIVERPTVLTYYVFNTSFTVHVQAYNSVGTARDIYVDSIATSFRGNAISLYLPPCPIQVLLDNGNAAAVSAIYSLVTARL